MKKKSKPTPTKAVAKFKFRPAGDRVLVKPQEAVDEKSPSGIIIPDTARKEKPETGVIIALGEGRRNERGEVISMNHKVGDVVMFGGYGNDKLELDGEEYLIVQETNILGTF